MGISFSDFKGLESSSFLSGGRRIIVAGFGFDEAKNVSAKGLWQQFKMSFLNSYAERGIINRLTIETFRDTLKEHYGENLFSKFEKTDKTLISKYNKGTKLLSRDVARLIRICDKMVKNDSTKQKSEFESSTEELSAPANPSYTPKYPSLNTKDANESDSS